MSETGDEEEEEEGVRMSEEGGGCLFKFDPEGDKKVERHNCRRRGLCLLDVIDISIRQGGGGAC